MKKAKKNYRFVVVVTCQGQPFYHYRNTLFGALIEYAYQYLKKNKYGTMNFTLRQEWLPWQQYWRSKNETRKR